MKLETRRECYLALVEVRERIDAVWDAITRGVPMGFDADGWHAFRAEARVLKLAVTVVLKRLDVWKREVGG